jgi:hypothetical protein
MYDDAAAPASAVTPREDRTTSERDATPGIAATPTGPLHKSED